MARTEFTKTGATIWRDLVAPGGATRQKPVKADIRTYLGEIETYLEALFDQVAYASGNLVTNSHLLHWDNRPAGLEYVETAGSSAGFTSRQLPNGRYGGPGGASGQYRFTRVPVNSSWPAALRRKKRYREEWEWLVGPDTASYEYASAERATYIELNAAHEPSLLMGRLARVRAVLSCGSGTLTAAPILSVSCGTPGWLVGQARTTTDDSLKYVTYPAGGSLYAYEATSSGTTGVAISGAANNGSGLIRLTVSSSANFTTGQTGVVVSQVGGVTAANGSWTITVIDSTHIDLQGSTFSGTYTSGGYIAKPPSHTTINAVVSDGGVSWKCLGYAKGRAYDIYESGPDSEDGTVYASSYAGTPRSGGTFAVTTTPTEFECFIQLPAPNYVNSSDYSADPSDSSRTLLPLVETTDIGGGTPYIGVCWDLIGFPATGQKLIIHDWEVIAADDGVSAEMPNRRLMRLLSEELGDLIADNLPSVLEALSALSSAGFAVRKSDGTFTARSFASSVANSNLTISNPAGESGNTTINAGGNLGGLAGLSTAGLVTVTGSHTSMATRAIGHSGSGLSWANGDGVAGAPTSSLADDLAAIEALSTTGFLKRTGSNTWSLSTTISAATELTGITPQANGGMYAAGGFRALAVKNNATTPNSQVDITAALAMVANSSGAIAVNSSLGTLTCDITTAGSAANGRDQAGAFTNGSWVHFWVIYNGSTWASLASASATAPTLPSGYTHKAYAGAIYLESGGTLRKIRISGDLAAVEASADASALSGGSSTTEASVDLAAYVPANALEFHPVGLMINSNTGAANTLRLISVSGRGAFTNIFAGQAASGPVTVYAQAVACMPYLGSTMYYQNSQSSGASYINIVSFRLPIGQL